MPANYDRNMQVLVNPPNPFPVAVLSGVPYKTGVMPLSQFNNFLGAIVGYNAITVALTSSQVVTITVQRYLDPAGLIPVGAAGTQATTANTAAYVALTTVVPAAYFDVQVSNASGTTAIITNVGLAMLPNP